MFLKEGASVVAYKCAVFRIHLMLPKNVHIWKL